MTLLTDITIYLDASLGFVLEGSGAWEGKCMILITYTP